MDGRYQSYGDYYRQANPAPSQRAPGEGPKMYNTAAALADKAMASVRASLESNRGESGSMGWQGDASRDKQDEMYHEMERRAYLGGDYHQGQQWGQAGMEPNNWDDAYGKAPSRESQQLERGNYGRGRGLLQEQHRAGGGDQYGYTEQAEYYDSDSQQQRFRGYEYGGASHTSNQYSGQELFRKEPGFPGRGRDWNESDQGLSVNAEYHANIGGRGRGQGSLYGGRGQPLHGTDDYGMDHSVSVDYDMHSEEYSRGANQFGDRGRGHGLPNQRGRGSNFERGGSSQYMGRGRGNQAQARGGYDQGNTTTRQLAQESSGIDVNQPETNALDQPASKWPPQQSGLSKQVSSKGSTRETNQSAGKETEKPATKVPDGASGETPNQSSVPSSTENQSSGKVTEQRAGTGTDVSKTSATAGMSNSAGGTSTKQGIPGPTKQGGVGTNEAKAMKQEPPEAEQPGDKKATGTPAQGQNKDSASGQQQGKSSAPSVRPATAKQEEKQGPSLKAGGNRTNPKPGTSSGGQQAGANDDDEDSEEDTGFCKLCNMSFDSAEKYFRHTRGLLHTQRQMAADEEKNSGGPAPEQSSTPKPSSASAQQSSWKHKVPQGQDSTSEASSEVPTGFGGQRFNQEALQSERFQGRRDDHSQYEEDFGDRYSQQHSGPGQRGRPPLHEERAMGHSQSYGGLGGGQREDEGDWSGYYGDQQQRQGEEEGKPWQQQLSAGGPARSLGGPAARGSGAATGRGGASNVQKRPAAATSQGLALISGDGEEEEWEEEDEEDWEEEGTKARAKGESSEFHCDLCDIETTGFVSLRAHLNGRNHKTVQEAVDTGNPVPRRLLIRLGSNAKVPKVPMPAASFKTKPADGPSVLLELLNSIPEAIVGLTCVKEFQLGRQPSFLCTICDSQCDSASIQTHLMGSKHRMKYLRDYRPHVYEHVKTHGGKKSQLSAFLEEVCSDIEKEEGRGKPILEKAVNTASTDKKAEPEAGGSKDAKPQPEKKEGIRKEPLLGTTSDVRHLPHEVVMANYKEEKWRREMIGRGYPPEELRRERSSYPEPGYREGPGYRDDMRRPFGPRDPYGYNLDRHYGRDYGPPRFGRERDYMDRDPYFDRERREGSYPPPRDYLDARPYNSEEERRRRMYAFEMYNFYHPMRGISPEEARRQMFLEYQRLGIPYDVACDRVLMQEDRRVRVVDYMREGMTLAEAQKRVMAYESRQQLIRDYERQGLTPREAQWRVVVEEERSRLFEDYERRGFTPLEARARIISGADRMHLIHEYERRGMPPEEARRRAEAEEARLRTFEDSLKRGLGERGTGDSRDNMLDDIAEKRMLQDHMQQGLTREDAENKVIAHLRQQGVPTQEAILRVQKIQVTATPPPATGSDSQDRGTCSVSHDRSSASRDPESVRVLPEEERARLGDPGHGDSMRSEPGRGDPVRSEPGRSDPIHGYPDSTRRKEAAPRKSVADFDDITPEEAKERLLQEYEKRGVPREQARQALISELIRSGVSEEEAKRRFSDSGKSPHSGGEDKKRDGRRERQSYTGYDYSRAHSRSPEPQREGERMRQSPRAYRMDAERDERSRGDPYSPRYREKERERSDRREAEKSRQPHREQPVQQDPQARPTLTLGEELRLRKLKRAGCQEQPGEIAAKIVRPATATATSTAAAGTSAVQPQPVAKQEPSRLEPPKPKPGATKPQSSQEEAKPDVTNLLESLTNNLISSEDDAAMALQVSKALTSALLKYRLKGIPEEKSEETPSQGRASFVERRIEDAKKLFESKMQGPGTALLSGVQAPKGAVISQASGSYGVRTDPARVMADSSGRSSVPSQSLPTQPSQSIPMELSLSNIPMPQDRPPQQWPPGTQRQQPKAPSLQRPPPQSQQSPFAQQHSKQPPLLQQAPNSRSSQQQQDAIYPDPEDAGGGIFDHPTGHLVNRDKNRPILPRVLYTKNHPPPAQGAPRPPHR